MLAFADSLALSSAFVLAGSMFWYLGNTTPSNVLYALGSEVTEVHSMFLGGLIFTSLIWFWGLGHYTRRRPFWDELLEVFRILGILAIMHAAVVFIADWHISRSWLLVSWGMAAVFVPLFRIFLKHGLILTGLWRRPMVIVGTGDNAREAAVALNSEPLLGLHIIAFLFPDEQEGITQDKIYLDDQCIPVMSLGSQPEAVLNKLGRPHIVVALEADSLQKERRLIERLRHYCPDINVVPPLRGLPLFSYEMSHFISHDVLFLGLPGNLSRRSSQVAKRLFDVIGASVLLLLLSPILACVTLLIWYTSGKDVLYKHVRVGKNGKPFTCYKFRTMVPDADEILHDMLLKDPKAREEWQHHFKLKNDPRITPFGQYLRKSSLDELPQLWNVLLGEMSLVGPRPVVALELERYGDHTSDYLDSGPGITGLWQISGRNDLSYSNRIDLDVWYTRNWSLWFDVVILFRTVKAVLTGRGAY